MTAIDTATRFLYRAAVAAFVATLAYTVWIASALPAELASPSGTFRTPILAFELARSRVDLVHVFGGPEDPLRSARIAAMLRGHELDAGYLVVYNLFLGVLLAAVVRETGRSSLRHALGLPLCAVAADAWENIILVALLARLEQPQELLARLAIATWCKWGAIALATAAAGIGLLALRRRVLGALALLPVPTVLVAYVDPLRYGELLSLSLPVSWIALVVHAVSRVREAADGGSS